MGKKKSVFHERKKKLDAAVHSGLGFPGLRKSNLTHWVSGCIFHPQKSKWEIDLVQPARLVSLAMNTKPLVDPPGDLT